MEGDRHMAVTSRPGPRQFVMAGLVPAIHAGPHVLRPNHPGGTAWMPGTRPGMTTHAGRAIRMGVSVEAPLAFPIPCPRPAMTTHLRRAIGALSPNA